jgi:hypothetical protein
VPWLPAGSDAPGVASAGAAAGAGVAPGAAVSPGPESRVWPHARATLGYARAATTGSCLGAGSRPPYTTASGASPVTSK